MKYCVLCNKETANGILKNPKDEYKFTDVKSIFSNSKGSIQCLLFPHAEGDRDTFRENLCNAYAKDKDRCISGPEMVQFLTFVFDGQEKKITMTSNAHGFINQIKNKLKTVLRDAVIDGDATRLIINTQSDYFNALTVALNTIEVIVSNISAGFVIPMYDVDFNPLIKAAER